MIIPNWNGRKHLKACLDSLRDQSFKDFTITVVDNSSTDGSTNFIRKNYPEVRIIELPRNSGFSAAVNLGIKQTKGELVALLNNDTETDPHWLGNLVAAMDRNPEVGFCASKMLNFRDRTILDAAGNALTRGGHPYQLGSQEVDTGQYDQQGLVFGACAGASIYRRSLFEDIGLFDEDFFAYFEDMDISFRAQLGGYKCLYVPEAICYHKGSRSSELSLRLRTRNLPSLWLKNIPGRILLKRFPSLFLTLLKAYLSLLRRGRITIIAASIIDTFRMLPRTIRKRRQIQKSRRVNIQYIESILWHGSIHYNCKL